MNRTIVSLKSGRQILLLLVVILVPTVLMWAAGEGRLEKTFDTTR
jgi:hypothetical protein